MHVTRRTLTFGERTYDLANELSVEVQVPKLFFGEETKQAIDLPADAEEDDDKSEDDDDESDDSH